MFKLKICIKQNEEGTVSMLICNFFLNGSNGEVDSWQLILTYLAVAILEGRLFQKG